MRGRAECSTLDKVKFLNRRSASTVFDGELVAHNVPQSPDEKRDVSGIFPIFRPRIIVFRGFFALISVYITYYRMYFGTKGNKNGKTS